MYGRPGSESHCEEQRCEYPFVCPLTGVVDQGNALGTHDAMADDDRVTKVPPDAIKKPGFAIIQGMPCRIAEVTHKPKATANGNKRLFLAGTHIFTGKKYEDTLNLTAGASPALRTAAVGSAVPTIVIREPFTTGFHGIDVPVMSKATFALMDVDASSGFLSLLTDGGDTKEDVALSRAEDGVAFDALGAEVVQRFEAGESLKITVLSIMGKELVDGVSRDTDT